MEKVRKLQAQARVLQGLLITYAQIDGDAEMVLKFMQPLFEDIAQGKVMPPKEFVFRWYFGSTDSPLVKFDDLINAAAEFSHTLEDWPTPIIVTE